MCSIAANCPRSSGTVPDLSLCPGVLESYCYVPEARQPAADSLHYTS